MASVSPLPTRYKVREWIEFEIDGVAFRIPAPPPERHGTAISIGADQWRFDRALHVHNCAAASRVFRAMAERMEDRFIRG